MADLSVDVWLCTANNPTPAEWTRACRGRPAQQKNGDVSRHRTFVVTDGGAPNAAQRKEWSQDTLRGYPVKCAVVTTVVRTNPVKRGIATALHWLNPQFRVFEPSEILLAIDHIGVTRARFDPIWRALQFLQGSMPPIKTLGLIATKLGLPLEPQPLPQFPSSRPPTL